MNIESIYKTESYFKGLFAPVAINYVNTHKLSENITISQAWYHANTQGYQESLTIFENNDYNNAFYAFKNKSLLMEAQSMKFDWKYYLNINNIANISNELDAVKHWHFIGKSNRLQYHKVDIVQHNQADLDRKNSIITFIQEEQNRMEQKKKKDILENELLRMEDTKQKNQRLLQMRIELEQTKMMANNKYIEQNALNKQKVINLQKRDEEKKKKEDDTLKLIENTVYKYANPILQNRSNLKQQEEIEINIIKETTQLKQKELNDKLADMIHNLEDTIQKTSTKKRELNHDITVSKEVVNNLKSIIN